MRFTLIIASAAALVLAASRPLPAATQQEHAATPVVATAAPAAQDVQNQPPRGGDVDVKIGVGEGTTVWYANPVWVAIGLLSVVIVALLIGMVARGSGGGGDTIVK